MENPVKQQTDESVDIGVQLYLGCVRAHRAVDVRSCFGSKLLPFCAWRYDPDLIIKTVNEAATMSRFTLYGEQAKQAHLAKQTQKSSSQLIIL